MNAPLRVLMVEDSASDAKLVVRALQQGGRRIDFDRVEAADTMRAALTDRSWDLVLSDWSMPKFSARAALDVLHEQALDLPFIIVSGSIGEETAVDAMRAGAHDYVLKDKLGRLLPVVERELRECKGRAAHRESEARQATMLESALDAIIGMDHTGRVTDWNAAAERLFGYSRVEAIGHILAELIVPEEHRAAHREGLARHIATGNGMLIGRRSEVVALRRDGTRMPVELSISRMGTTVPPSFMGFVRDISERKQAERAREEVLERVRIEALSAEAGLALALGASLPDILRRCAEAMVTHLDVAVARIWTVKTPGGAMELQASSGIEGGFDIDLVTGGREPYFTNDFASSPFNTNLAWTKSEGLSGFAAHPLLAAGQLIGFVALFARHPLSAAVHKGLASLAGAIAVGIQRKIAEEAGASLEIQLRQAQKMEAIGRLAGGIAHDFNNVLSVILSYGELILGDLKPGDPLREDIEEIHNAGLRAAALTRQLVMFSRQQVIEPRVLDLNELLAGTDKMLRRLVGEDVELISVAAPSLGRVTADPGSIDQVIMNLVVNSRDAMPTGGKLTLETANVELDDAYVHSHFGAKAGSYVMLSVTDTGTGMDKATLARIFEPFFTTKDVGKGTGIGLSTVFGIVQQSGGNIWVYSEPGVGTTFKVYLPRVDAMADAPDAAKAPTTLRGTETILLVEDEDQLRTVACGILRRHGYTVIEARGAAEAVPLSAGYDGPIHLLLSDVVMPRMSGPALARQLLQTRPEMRLLCMSGYTDDAAVRHGVIDAHFAYLQKPLTVSSLTKKVRAVLDVKA